MKLAVILSGSLENCVKPIESIKNCFKDNSLEIDWFGHSFKDEHMKSKDVDLLVKTYPFKEFVLEEYEPSKIGINQFNTASTLYSMWKCIELSSKTGRNYDLIFKFNFNNILPPDMDLFKCIPYDVLGIIPRWIMPIKLEYSVNNYYHRSIWPGVFFGDQEGIFSAAEIYPYLMAEPLENVQKQNIDVLFSEFLNIRNINVIDPAPYFKLLI